MGEMEFRPQLDDYSIDLLVMYCCKILSILTLEAFLKVYLTDNVLLAPDDLTTLRRRGRDMRERGDLLHFLLRAQIHFKEYHVVHPGGGGHSTGAI